MKLAAIVLVLAFVAGCISRVQPRSSNDRDGRDHWGGSVIERDDSILPKP